MRKGVVSDLQADNARKGSVRMVLQLKIVIFSPVTMELRKFAAELGN